MKRDGKTKPTVFLQKTYDILSNSSLHSIITWDESGTSFLIKKVTDFCSEVLPTYFKHSNYASFVRQLNMYGFQKLRELHTEIAFKHPLFLRNRPELLSQIQRKTSETQNFAVVNTEITTKISVIETKHREMAREMQDLEARNVEMTLQNQCMVRELGAYKEREQKLEKLLVAVTTFIGNSQATDLQSLACDFDQPFLRMLPDSIPSEDHPSKRSKITEIDGDSVKSEELEGQGEEIDD